MNKRLELHEVLCDILGSRNVYYQPPETVKMKYPAIVYSINNIDNGYGDNLPYIQNYAYMVILIDKNPDSEFIDKLANHPRCRFIRNYQSENLNHNVFLLYF